jgi:hypothetical protein
LSLATAVPLSGGTPPTDCLKKAAAFFKKARSCSKRLTSRRNCTNSWRSDVVKAPWGDPCSSIRDWLTHLRKALSEMPNSLAIWLMGLSDCSTILTASDFYSAVNNSRFLGLMDTFSFFSDSSVVSTFSSQAQSNSLKKRCSRFSLDSGLAVPMKP